MLQKFLTQHNLSIADLEQRGAAAPDIQEGGHDLGKAAFKWKLNLADVIADHYFCYSLTDHTAKVVKFVGRPDNVESLQMLYTWIIDQIKRISADERRKHEIETGEHIDPLRWQVGFGLGAVSRLSARLEARRRAESDAARTALAVHHLSEISDYLEKKGHYQPDGRETEEDRKYRLQREDWQHRMDELKVTDIEAYYTACPWDRPETEEQKAARAKQEERDRKREERNAARRTGRPGPKRDWAAEEQKWTARAAGKASADRINLEPFVGAGKTAAGELK